MIAIICAIVFVLVVIWGADRHLLVKEIEVDLKKYLCDVMDARDVSDSYLKVHFDAQVFSLKTLLRKHFKLND